MRKHTPAICLTILLLFLAQPIFPQDTPAAETAYPKEVEIVLTPGSITSIRIRGSSLSRSEFTYETDQHLKLDDLHKQTRQAIKRHMTPLPYADRYTEDQLRELRNDQGKLNAVSYKQMQELLGDQQYYLWRELTRSNDMLEDLAEKAHENKRRDIFFVYTVNFDLENSPQGIQSLEYAAESYIDAKAIVDGLQQGAIKSVLVESEILSSRDKDTEKWVVCKNYCGIKAFIY